ncbi:precorrin-3B synthase [Sulfitobacter faviae]|uniref:Precorrin-3B synthase n=1 Tax=Sulfitobacter faviae TaxID=1775881 RepID=A0ABZ0V1S6_9RHOB|nr:precorrin-3B synthase [Sulfitobacter faviae]WPZ21958.1 precorrin-3B synthase [Sulfitobacter faviae]
MSAAPAIKGWCPGALRPMLSGDGLVVRLRVPQGRLTPAQARGVAGLGARYGNGMLDLSNRGNLQLRGVDPARHEGLIDALRALALIDVDERTERRRNIMVSPFWQAGDDTDFLCQALSAAAQAHALPDVSAKFGYAVDAGPQPVLQADPADIRFERSAGGQLLLCIEGAVRGKPVTRATAVTDAIALAEWVRAQGVTRAARATATGAPLPAGFDCPRQAGQGTPAPGLYPAGALVACAFGQMEAETLAALAELGPLRLTPWRRVLIEGAPRLPDLAGLITAADDPLLRVVACIGAPGCAQGRGETRGLARRLAAVVSKGQRLHVSGCAKGCAAPRATDLTLTATAPERYDLIHDGRADAIPDMRGLTPATIASHLRKSADAP